jgi:7,8-dihydropterin-6-yl-methyl-4-(beta-D-ribofuranosyl)aminobenzene 5'-phosphate synthase
MIPNRLVSPWRRKEVLSMGSRVTIAILSENTSYRCDLRSEHGLSVWIEAYGSNILFDTGQSSAFAANARTLGIDLAAADHLVLSHGHSGHTGGIPRALGLSSSMQVHLHPQALKPRYTWSDPGGPRYIGMPGASRFALDGSLTRCRFHTRAGEIARHVYLTGFVPRRTPFERTAEPFTTDRHGTCPDILADDQALWIETPEGLLVVLGCAHAGVVNTLEHIRAVSGRSDIRAIIGGMHLASAGEPAVAGTAEALASYPLSLVAPNHCTGEEACAVFEELFAGIYRPGPAGTVFSFPA